MNAPIRPAEYSVIHSEPCVTYTDPLIDVRLEEAVLSSMASGKKVESLDAHHFTSKVRQALYLLMRSGVAFEELADHLRDQGLQGELGYVADLFVVPMLPRTALIDAVAELKRLHLMRRFCADVDAWRRGAPSLDWNVALKRLGEVIRRQGEEATKELCRRPPR